MWKGHEGGGSELQPQTLEGLNLLFSTLKLGGAVGQEVCKWLLGARRGKKMHLRQSLSEERSPSDTVISVQ